MSFISLVRREWSDRDGFLPNRNYGLTQVARAIVAWVALQGVTQEWQEKRWFYYLKELDVKEKDKIEQRTPVTTMQRPRRFAFRDSFQSSTILITFRYSHIRVTSDVIFPGHGGPQIISADIGEAPLHTPISSRSRNSTLSSISSLTMAPIRLPSPVLSRAPSLQHMTSPITPSFHLRSYSYHSSYPFPTAYPPEPLPFDELKSTLRRLSKVVLAGYGGASLLFFGVTPYPKGSQKGEASEKREEEETLEVAVDAAEAEAAGDCPDSNLPQIQLKYSWWDLLLGKHDQEIFEQSAISDEEGKKKEKARATEKTKKDKMKATAIIGAEHLMPRFWVLTDYNRGQVVLVIRGERLHLNRRPCAYRWPGTMSLNELAVDLTCHPESFQPAQTQGLDIDEEDDIREHHTPGNHTPRMFGESEQERNQSPYHVHSGMLRMAKAMGEIGKPVQLAVQDALYHNPEFGKNLTSCCGFGQTLLIILE